MEAPMEYTITGKSQEMLEEKLASYKKLAIQRVQLRARLEKTEAQKDSVSDKIYERVKTEYEGKLENLRSQLDPIESEIQDMKRDDEKELAGLVEQISLLEEELAEAEFRHRVDEYDTAKLREIMDRVNPDLKEKSKRKTEILDQLRLIRKTDEAIKEAAASVEDDTDEPADSEPSDTGVDQAETEPVDVEPVDAEPVDEPATEENDESPGDNGSGRLTLPSDDPLEALTDKPAKSAEPEPEPEPEAASEEKAENNASFENPQSWINEFGDEKPAAAPSGSAEDNPSVETAEPENKEDDDDPLSALADPSDEQRAGAAESPAEKSDEVCMGFPNLVMITGRASGKKIPLLPMTMSIGREHDNNIELKDPEVGRYHARILYERGRFVLEDLESSNGTWINGERSEQSILKNGDRIKIGGTEMVIDFD
jgi:hypothetical protein